MASDPPTRGHTAASIAAHLAARGQAATVRGDGALAITHPDTIERGRAGAITFIRSPKFAGKWAQSSVSAALVTPQTADALVLPPGRALLVVNDPDMAMIEVLRLFEPPARPRRAGVHASAVVDPSAKIAPDVQIGPCCTVGAGAHIGAGATLMAGVHVGDAARIGERTILHPGVRILDRCEVGGDCILHAGVVIGADGFGYRPGPRGPVKIPHIGNAVIGDYVEIGANSCVDRAKFSSTMVGSHTKIDNLCQIGHNCEVGRACILCGHCALAGSVKIGDGALIGGMCGVSDNIEIGAGVTLAAGAMVICDIPAGETWFGVPAGPMSEGRRNYAAFRSLAQTLADVRKRLKSIEEK